MPIVGLDDLLRTALRGGHGVCSFNVVHIEHAEAIVAAAESVQAGVTLQISENCVRYHGALAPLGTATLAMARAADVPVAVHLDHATTSALCREAVGLGFGSVMFDASRLPYADNVRATVEAVEWCHARGVSVEAELGEVGGKDGVHAPGVRTDPDEAAAYVAATGVDALAVAVGTSHAMLTRDAALDVDRVSALHAVLPVPLVLHGSSGVPERDLVSAVRHGMTKINIATQLNKKFTAAVRNHLTADEAVVDPRRYMAEGRAAVTREAEQLLRMLALPRALRR